jgi:hypothetical protein
MHEGKEGTGELYTLERLRSCELVNRAQDFSTRQHKSVSYTFWSTQPRARRADNLAAIC